MQAQIAILYRLFWLELQLMTGPILPFQYWEFRLAEILFACLLPPSMQIFEGLESLRDLVPDLDRGFRYTVEAQLPATPTVSASSKNRGSGPLFLLSQLTVSNWVCLKILLRPWEIIGRGRINCRGRVIDKHKTPSPNRSLTNIISTDEENFGPVWLKCRC